MKLLQSIFLLLMYSFSNGLNALEEDSSIPPNFILYYGNVSHVVMHGEGCFDELLEHDKREQLVQFWWGYVLKECHDYISSSVEAVSKAGLSTSDSGQGKEYMQTIIEGCGKSVIYDNWEEINKSITKDPKKTCK